MLPGPAVVLTLLLAFAAAVSASESDIAAILRAIDDQSNITDTDFAAMMTFVIQDVDKGIERLVVLQFRRDAEDKLLLLMQEPVQRWGQGYLRDGENLWYYDPQSRLFSHTSLKENVEGTHARTRDFMRSSFADDYRIVAYESDTLGQYSVFVVDLEAVRDEVPDPFIRMWVTRDSNLVLKVESYSLSKRLVRTALYPRYQMVGTAIIPRQIILIDELIPGNRTQITLTDVSLEALETDVFTKAFVERVSR